MKNHRRFVLKLLASVFALTEIAGSAQTTIFSDNFSGSYPGAWSIGHDGGGGSYAWAWPNGYAHEYSGTSSGQFFYPDNLHVYMERRGVSLVGYTSAALNFSYIADTETTFDFFTVNIRDSSGVWHEMFRKSGPTDPLNWTSKQIDLSQFAGQSGLYIQFRFDSDGSVSGSPYDGVFVDGVSLVATATPFVPYFSNARIVNRVDQDGDGYARQFDIEFDVDSNVAGNYYVKIWEDDGGFGLDDYLTQSATFAVNGTPADYHGVTIACSSYASDLGHGTAEFRLDLYNAANDTLVQTWRPANDPDLGNVLVELSSEDFLPDPYGVGALEPSGIGLFSTIPVENRNNLTDLANLKNNGLYYGNRPVNSTDRKLIIAIHGWNLNGVNDARLTSISGAINTAIASGQISADWRVIAYDWSRDADTGITDATLQSKQTKLANAPLNRNNVEPEIWFESGATQAAERAYQHGLLIGAKILQQVGAGNLQAVHLVG
ncbi:MAG: hypothetical protein EPO07_13230, partial [Verrucomicrobia bacterium]